MFTWTLDLFSRQFQRREQEVGRNQQEFWRCERHRGSCCFRKGEVWSKRKCQCEGRKHRKQSSPEGKEPKGERAAVAREGTAQDWEREAKTGERAGEVPGEGSKVGNCNILLMVSSPCDDALLVWEWRYLPQDMKSRYTVSVQSRIGYKGRLLSIGSGRTANSASPQKALVRECSNIALGKPRLFGCCSGHVAFSQHLLRAGSSLSL
jgi:hypothetical protein